MISEENHVNKRLLTHYIKEIDGFGENFVYIDFLHKLSLNNDLKDEWFKSWELH